MNDASRISIRADRSRLEQALKDAGAEFKGKAIKCPFHEDRYPSGSIYHADDGAFRFKCQAASCGFCGDVFDVMARATHRKSEDVLRELSPAPRQAPAEPPPIVFPTIEALKAKFKNAEATYIYTHPVTRAPELIVLRLLDSGGRKSFIQASPCSGGGFVLKVPAGPRPIYNRTRVAAAPEVVIVEGEKCVHALKEVGIVATTSPGGARNAHHADWSPLAGKTCYLWPDHDAPNPTTKKRGGEEYMRTVAKALEQLDPPATALWVDPDTLGLNDSGDDVVEYLEQFGGETPAQRATAVRAALSLATPIGGSAALADLIEQTIAGQHRTIPFPWSNLTRLTRAFTPGSVTVLCGDPGSSKSLLVIELAAWWQRNAVKTGVFMLEESREYHLNRALAQADDNADLADSEWVFANPDETRQAYARHRPTLDALAPCITTVEDEQVTHDVLLNWIRARAVAGNRIIIIDPVTAVAVSDRPWMDDLKFLIAAKRIVRDYGCSLLLVTHPRLGKKAAGRKGGQSTSMLDDLAGGAAFPRFSQAVLWLVRHEEPKDVRCTGPAGPFPTTINRSVRIAKTRNGPGAGAEIGFIFDPRTLRFCEQGLVMKKGRESAEGESMSPGETKKALQLLGRTFPAQVMDTEAKVARLAFARHDYTTVERAILEHRAAHDRLNFDTLMEQLRATPGSNPAGQDESGVLPF